MIVLNLKPITVKIREQFVHRIKADVPSFSTMFHPFLLSRVYTFRISNDIGRSYKNNDIVTSSLFTIVPNLTPIIENPRTVYMQCIAVDTNLNLELTIGK